MRRCVTLAMPSAALVALIGGAQAQTGVAAVADASSAGTQTTQAGEQPPEAQSAGLADIVVTAQRRQQTLQEVPVSVAVIDASLVQQQHITNISGLGEIVPNLAITTSPFQPFVSIRGLGSGAGTRAFEQSVATYVDGIYAGRASQFLNPFFDIERVEVVRGPQSVLFGVNAIAGAINIVNKRPGADLEGYVTSGYEIENHGYNVEGGISIPVSSTFGIRVAGRADREGPYLTNNVTGKEEPDIRSQIGRIVGRWRPTSDLDVTLEYEHAFRKVDGNGFQTVYLPLLTVFPTSVEDGVLDRRKSTPGTANFTRLKTDNVTLNVDYALGGFNIRSASGYSAYRFAQALPAGSVPTYFGTAAAAEKFRQFYQEVRLESPDSSRFKYLIGGTYYHQDLQLDQGIDFDLTAFGAPGITAAIRNGLDQDTDAVSVFAQGTFDFTDALGITAGARYSSIRKQADYVIAPTAAGQPLSGYTFVPASAFILRNLGYFSYVDPAVPATVRASLYERSRRFNAFNPAISLNYRPSRQTSVYASFTTGTKAGGFNDQEKTGVAPENGLIGDSFEYDAEKARNFELGGKFGSRTFRFNVAAFYSKYRDLQASQATQNGSIRTTNAASATAKGIELDATILLTPRLTLSGDFAYIHARYDDYPGSGCIITLTSQACDPAAQNARGGRLDAVPDFTGSANLAYVVPLSERWELRSRGRAYYNDGAQYQSNQDPIDRTPHYWFLDAYLTLAQREKGLSFSVSGRNLTNKLARGFSAPAATPLFGHQSYILPTRTIFLDARFDF